MTAESELRHLARGIQRCRRCRLHAARRHAVPGEGPANAPVVLLGEAPGETEDRSGRPFAGRAGDFLDRLLQEQALSREAVFITSCVKCRPPDNRTPRRDEIATCTGHWLQAQLDCLDPQVVVLLGRVATRTLLGLASPLTGLHGQVFERGARRFLVTYHPAAGMRFPASAAAMRADFGVLKGLMEE